MTARPFALSDEAIRDALDALSRAHPAVARAVADVGVPAKRQRPEGFRTLAHIIIGQQLSTKAAASISRKVTEAVGGELTADALAATGDDVLRGAGLSRQKLSYMRSLTDAVVGGSLPIARLSELPDDEVVAHITAVRGFGEWSAHMYLMFSLGRPDIWPVGDLAVRGGFGRLLGMQERPAPREARDASAPFRPYRSALALLCWRVYSAAPL